MKNNADISIRWRNGGNCGIPMGGKDTDIIKSRNGLKRMRHPYLAHLCPVQRGVVVVFLLSASDDLAIGTKLRTTLSPILGHLLLCCAKPHPCSL